MKVLEASYYSDEMNKAFFSASQYKAFLKCPAATMASIRGEWKQPKSKALLLGSYVDEALTGTPESQREFITANEKEIYKKGGGKYAEFVQADETIELVRKQPLMMKYLDGEHQTIMVGEIEGVPFKIKMDSYREGEFIADLKYMASLRSPNLFEPMVKYWGYDVQAAIYQEIVWQNTGKRLPFMFVVATKENPPHLAVGEINQYNMDDALAEVKKNIHLFNAIKRGESEAWRCEDYGCNYCTSTKILTEPIDTDWFGMNTAQMKAMKGEL